MSYDEMMIELCMEQKRTDELLDRVVSYINAHGLEAFIHKVTKSYTRRQSCLKNAPDRKIWRRPEVIKYLESVKISPKQVVDKI